jgi:hypothetical protein
MDEKTTENDVDEKSTNEPKKSKTYSILIAVTVIYLGLFYAVMMETTTCTTDIIANISWLRYPMCDSFGPNELGDTLAGAFAPLAFLWLAGTVYIQSQELREQRRELTETRDVMKAQLALSQAQVKETQASTGYFAEQTAILKRQQELREQGSPTKSLIVWFKQFGTCIRHDALTIS